MLALIMFGFGLILFWDFVCYCTVPYLERIKYWWRWIPGSGFVLLWIVGANAKYTQG